MDATHPFHLWLGEPTADSWTFRSLGPYPASPLSGLEVFGLTPDGRSVLLGMPQRATEESRPWVMALAGGSQYITALYRVRLDGSGWEPIAQALPFGIIPRSKDGR